MWLAWGRKELSKLEQWKLQSSEAKSFQAGLPFVREVGLITLIDKLFTVLREAHMLYFCDGLCIFCCAVLIHEMGLVCIIAYSLWVQQSRSTE